MEFNKEQLELSKLQKKIKKLSHDFENQKSINEIISDKIVKNDVNNTNDLSDINDELELIKLDEELLIKLDVTNPKNHGKIWSESERKKIKKLLQNNIYKNNNELFDEQNILVISKTLERTEYAIKEEIKKMLFNDYMNGIDYDNLTKIYNIPESNIKIIIKLFIDKNSKKIIDQLENENKLLKLKVENIKLKKEISELNNV
jgi:hypothetical protein